MQDNSMRRETKVAPVASSARGEGFLMTVIIPTCNRVDSLRTCLNTLAPGAQTGMQLVPVRNSSAEPDLAGETANQNDYEVIVSNDGDVWASGALTDEFTWARFIQGPHLGPAANRNAAARLARGEWLVFTDDDCIPEPGFLNAYAGAILSAPGTAEVIEGFTYSSDMPRSIRYEAPVNTKAGNVPSCNFAIRHRLFDEALGFDERYFPSYEDIEFVARLRRMGAQFDFCPGARVNHPCRPIPSCRVLANRWRPRLTYAFDMGAAPVTAGLMLLNHAARVITGRIFMARSLLDLMAVMRFLGELFWLGALLPKWVKDCRLQRRSAFWAEQTQRGFKLLKYGF